MPSLASHLKNWRLFKDLTQEELADRSGIPRPNIVALERGERDCTVTTLQRLAYALGLSPGRLLDRFPGPQTAQGLTRREIDAIARGVVSGRSALPRRFNRLYEAALGQVEPLLRAVGAKKPYRIRKRTGPVDREALRQVLERVRRLLPSVLSGVRL